MNRQRGMTIVELLVSLAVVMLIIGAATTAYVKLLTTYKTQGRLAESYMANLTGLELLRYDIETAGFGVPAILAAGANYTEAAAKASYPFAPDTYVPFYDPGDPKLNDSANVPNGPRAIAHWNNGGRNGSDVLAIKSCSANMNNNPTGKRWTMVQGSSGAVTKWADATMNFANTDYFIALDNTGKLLFNPANQWQDAYYTGNAVPGCPINNLQIYYIYGLDNSVNNATGVHRMPFNRVDYYLDNDPNFPSSKNCAAGTHTLFRSTINQPDGKLIRTPLIDCVQDFQAAFGLDPSGGTNPAATIVWQQALVHPDLTLMTAQEIQQQLREVRVFILIQEGLGKIGSSPDLQFSGCLNLGDQDIASSLVPGTIFQQSSSAALAGSLSSFCPSANNVQQYRWKILELSAKQMNLFQWASGTR